MFCAKVLGALAIAQVAIAQDVDYAQFVNPFIGTEGAIPGYACKSTLALLPVCH